MGTGNRDGHGARVELSGWGWRHAGRADYALRGVDLVIEPGERVLLLGASGAGKSTLLHALAGLTGPNGAITGEEEGRLLVDGKPATSQRGRIGLVAQDPESQLVMARAGDDVAFGLEDLGVPREQIWARVDEALARVGFPYGRAHPTAALSGGEKQRLVIAGVLAMRPRLLLLDEPTANLDPPGARLIRDVLARLLADTGATLVLVEHRVADVVDLVDRVVVVEPGGESSPTVLPARCSPGTGLPWPSGACGSPTQTPSPAPRRPREAPSSSKRRTALWALRAPRGEDGRKPSSMRWTSPWLRGPRPRSPEPTAPENPPCSPR